MTRRRAGAVGWVAVLAVAAVALDLAGRGSLAPPPLGDPGRWADWLAGREPVAAAFALLRMVAAGGLWYLLAVTAVGLVLRLAGALRLVAVADRFTVGPVRRILAGAVGLGLAASGVLAVAGPAARLHVAAAAQSTTTPPTTAGPAGSVTMHQLSPGAPVPGAVPPAVTEVAPAAGGSSGRWTVRPGQCFWSIAETVLTTHLGRPATDADIVPYWRRLIEANRHELAQRDNPDLIFPGQVFEVPAP